MIRSSVLITHVGRTTERDALPQAADYLATLEGVETVIVFGIVHDPIHLSARSPDPRIHVGDVLREVFEDVGSADGHHDSAGGEIPLGIFADYTADSEQLLDIVEPVITERLIVKLGLADSSTG
ncbi:DHHA1 domain protein [Halalkalicoccus paucihalophilus]|uniref:DHHA1 domain protein n=1 Tax=Halalkalicoccus paucihalophilus TaxID=1008153 RepID=A0A151A7T2_9EURY|nr:DHH family phosphoesterase [Halalkalicoccus paucihalophilus]KYH23756.1 DHHA1 domain protein [Halalkalicoccus paucihalophilus]